METQTSHDHAARLKIALLLVLALGMVGAAYALYQLGLQAYERMQASAQQQALDDASPISLWIDMLVWLVLIPAFGKALLVARRLHWGADLTWSQGQWLPSDPMALRPGAGAPLAEALRQPIANKKIGLWVIGAIAGMALLGAGGAAAELLEDLFSGGSISPLPLLPLLGALAFAGVVAYAGVILLSSRVQFDDVGLCEANFFRSKRLPWSAVHALRQGGAATYPHAPSSDSDENAWLLLDAQGRTLMRIANDMTPAQSLAVLQSRVAADAGSWADPAAQQVETTLQSEEETPAMQALRLAHQAHVEQFDRGFNRSTLIGMVSVLALFLLPAAFSTYQALWFRFAAAQAEGEVVELALVSAEGPKLTSLIVRYEVAGAAASAKPLRIESDGTQAYAEFKVGDRLRVFYDPQQPENARLDLFWELWIGSILLGGVAAVMGLIMALIARGLKPRRAA